MKKTLLFIHGNSCSSEYFHHQKNAEIFKGFDMHFLNLEGHGIPTKYSLDYRDYSIQNQSQKAMSYIKEHDLSSVVVIGHSLGGHIALRMKSLDEENVISGLFIYGTPPLDLNLRLDLAFHQISELSLLFANEWSDESVHLVLNVLFSDLDKSDLSLVKEMLAKSSGFARESFFRTLSAPIIFDEIDFLMCTKTPYKLLAGKGDKIVNVDYFKQLKDKVLVEFTNFSHAPHIEKPNEFNNLVFDFVCNLNFNNTLRILPITEIEF